MMGLLDDLLGGFMDQGRDRPAPGRAPAQTGGGSGMGDVMRVLLPVVLAMLANRGGAAGERPRAGASEAGGMGGLGDLLGSLLGGASGGSGASGGGLGDLLSQLQRAGYGEQARSWVSRGDNLPLPPGALDQVFGRGGLAEIARRTGLSEEDASRGLSELLPEVVDRVTPDGELPEAGSLAASVDALTRRMGAR